MFDEQGRRLARLSFAAVALAVLAILFINSRYGIIFGQTGSYPHYIQTVVPSAFEVIPGERVVAGGETVGEITRAEVTPRGLAHLVLGLDDSVWPVPTDSVLTLRMGGTIKYTDRFVSLAKGHAGTYFSDNGSVPSRQFVVPVEYGDLFNIFNAPTRAGLRGMFANGGPTFNAAARPFHSALSVAPPMLANAAAVIRDLGYDQQALSSLVSSTAEVSGAVATSNPGVRTLLDGAAGTFGSIASQSTALQRIVASAATSLQVQGVLYHHLGRDLPRLARMADSLQPGAVRLDQLAGPLAGTLQELVAIEPTAVGTLRTVRQAGPALVNLLADARTKLMPQLASVGGQSATELTCVRPYTPEMMSTLQAWGAWQTDGLIHPHLKIMRALTSLLPVPSATSMDTEQLTKILPGLGVNVPPMPGESWNQTWAQPQCGITARNSIAANDSEAGTYNPNDGGKLAPYPSTTPTYK